MPLKDIATWAAACALALTMLVAPSVIADIGSGNSENTNAQAGRAKAGEAKAEHRPGNGEVTLSSSEAEAKLVEDGLVTISGQVLDLQTGAPISGASVTLLNRGTESDENGYFSFANVLSERTAYLYIRIVDAYDNVVGCSQLEVKVAAYPLAVNYRDHMIIANLDTLADVDVVVEAEDYSDRTVDEACNECHKPNPCMSTSSDPSQWESVTTMGGIAVKLDEYEEFKERILTEGVTPEMYNALRYKDVHKHEMDMAQKANDNPELFKLPRSLPLSGDRMVTCDTCHTRHEFTPYTFFSRLDFEEQSELCAECHN